MKQIIQLDARIFHWLVTHKNTQENMPLARFFKLISKTADGHLYPVVLLLMFWLDNTHGYLFLYTALMAYALEVPLYIFLKHIIKRPRPCDLLFQLTTFVCPVDKFSLPSGHTAAAFLLATTLSYFYPSAAIPIFLWASSVGLSRVILRVHYPLDIIVGALLGLAVSTFSILCLH